jgi:DUF4097 and DUF4098 domain-containing protein YvlB
MLSMAFKSGGNMLSRHSLAACALALAAAAPATGQERERCAHEATRTATLAVARGGRLDLEAGAGSLEVRGRRGLQEVRLQGRACAATEALLRAVTVESRVANGIVHVAARYPESRGFDWNDSYAYLDLVIEVPAGLAVSIEDGSGSVVLDGVGDVSIEDGSGDLRITSVAGRVTIDDGSGNVVIGGVGEDVEIDDGSGDVRIEGVRANVMVEDGSGEIDIRDVTGTVRVSDGSGSIRVEGIGGDFIVDEDGSGGIRHGGVRGRVRIPDED